MDIFLRNLGLIGSVIFASAYIPQIIHLLKTKNSTGISIISWCSWLFGAILLFIYAVYLQDIVFLLLIFLEIIFLITTILLSIKYKKKR